MAKLTAQIRKKDELGDDLKFIDFHQLQIENKKYLKEIDDKNGKLLKSKISTGKIIKQWNDMKNDLTKQINKKKEYLEGIRDEKKQTKLIEQQKTDIEGESFTIRKEKGELEDQIKKIEKEGTMNIQFFISDKKKEALLENKIKNYTRKIDIMQMKYKFALKHLGLNEKDVDAEISQFEAMLADRQRHGSQVDRYLAKDEIELIK